MKKLLLTLILFATLFHVSAQVSTGAKKPKKTGKADPKTTTVTPAKTAVDTSKKAAAVKPAKTIAADSAKKTANTATPPKKNDTSSKVSTVLLAGKKTLLVSKGNSVGITRSDSVGLTFQLTGTTKDPQTIKLDLNGNSAEKNYPSVSPVFTSTGSSSMTIQIPGSSYDDAGHGRITVPVYITYKLQKTDLDSIVSANIQIDGGSKTPYYINFDNQKDNLSTFWAEIGANFSQTEGLKPSNLYAGVFAFEKDITKFKLGNKDAVISFTGGAYEAESKTLSNSSDSGLVYRDGRSYTSLPNYGYPYYRDTGSVATTTTIQSVGIFFSPAVRLNGISTSNNGFHIYFAGYFEMLWQRVVSTFDYSKTANVSTYYALSTPALDEVPYKASSINLDFRSHYLGGGFPIYLKHDDYTFYLNPVFGWTTQKFALINQSTPDDQSYTTKINNTYLVTENDPTNKYTNSSLGFEYPKRNWNTFYLAQFRLTSEKYGVSFTGEVRGFFLTESKPIITFTISKKFDVGSLLSGFVSKPATAAATPSN